MDSEALNGLPERDRLREIVQQLNFELERQSAKLRDLHLDLGCRSDYSKSRSSLCAPLPAEPEPSRSRRSGSSGPFLRPAFREDVPREESLPMSQLEIPVAPQKQSLVGPRSAISMEQQRKAKLMVMRAEKTRTFSASKPWYVINPESSRFATMWQCITCSAMVFVAFVTPIQVGLFEMEFDGLLVASLCVDVIFLADMVLQFFTMYPKRTARGIVWEDRLKKITKHYLKSWFCLDLLTLIPFDIVSIASGAGNLKEFKGIKVVRVLRLLKLMRIFRTSKLIHKLEVGLSIPYQHMALIRFLLILILVCHWMACTWAMTLKLVEEEQFPQWIDDIAAVDSEYGVVTRDDAFRVYVASFYFCSYTMTSVGYGDIGPKNLFERVACTVIVLIAGLCWAYILGEVGAIVTDMNAEKQGFRKKMNSLNKMMQEQGLPQELRKRLRSFFLSNKHQAQYARDQQLLTNMSPQLQAEVSITLNWQWLLKVSFFRQFIKLMDIKELSGVNTDPYRACIADIAHSMECRAYAQQELFGELQALFILSRGLVAINSRVALVGTVWGEDFVLADMSLVRPVSAFALTYLEVLCLTRAMFMTVIERRKSTCPQLGQIVRHYCVRVAARRGVLSEAAKRLRLPKARSVKANGKELRKEITTDRIWATAPVGPVQPDSFAPILPIPGSLDRDDQ
ncbi:unnamed protein product [Effrenium voratum]|nr:unnamed protein product [Effrenium voratum]